MFIAVRQIVAWVSNHISKDQPKFIDGYILPLPEFGSPEGAHQWADMFVGDPYSCPRCWSRLLYMDPVKGGLSRKLSSMVLR